MKGIDPKYVMYLGLLVTIEQAIGHGTVSLTNLVPVNWSPYITSWCNFLAFVGTSIMTYQAAVSSPMPGPLVNTPISPAAKAVVVLAILTGAFMFAGSAHAQAQPKFKTPAQIQSDIDSALKGANQKVASSVTGQPAADSAAALPCMDITMLPKLTPFNLMPTMKACVQDVNNQLVSDTQRALDSAKAFAGNPTGSGSSTAAIGDNDAINCLTPALALFKAAAIVPAVPDVLNTDGSVKTPGTPELDPGPILLGQKFREFTLAGGLTSCQNWVNEPINAVAAAGVAGVGTAVAGAALLPK